MIPQPNSLIKTLSIFILLSIAAAHFVFAQTSVKKNIFFDYDDSALRPQSKETLNIYIDKLNKNPGAKLSVVGYADSKGNADYNKKLSERRVKAVVDYLVKKGVQKKSINAKSLGSTTRFSKGQSESALKMNRRVELSLVIKKEKEAASAKTAQSEKEAPPRSKAGSINTVRIENVVTHELKKIAAQNIEYTTPAEMKQGEPGLVEAKVSESIVKNLHTRLNNSTYKKISAVSDVDLQGLSLSADGFLIKKLEGEKFGRWAWEITPNEKGLNSITLATVVKIDSKEGTQNFNVPLFLKAVDVKSKPAYYISNFMSKSLYIIFAVLIALGIFTMISKSNKAKNIKRSNG